MGINNKFRVMMVLIILFGSFILTGCKETFENNDKVKIAYVGDSTELPLITAFEEGYFKDEGLDVELVKVDSQEIASSLNNKNFDGITCDYRVFKYIEDGSNIKIGAGLYSGSINVLVGKESNIEKIDDLKNKKIGIQKRKVV